MSLDNFDKVWLQLSLNNTAIRRAQEAIESLGMALPCRVVAVNGGLVTVSFEILSSVWQIPQITIPKNDSPYFQNPTQVGDKGVTRPCDVYLGGISGQGGGTASLQRSGNMSSLIFEPVAPESQTLIDPNAAQIQAPNGAIIQTTSGTTCSIVANGNNIVLTYGSVTITLNSTGATVVAPTATVDGNLVVSGSITGNGSGGASMQGPITTTGEVSGASLSAGNGATGSFTASSGQTITVTDGIITGIS